MDCVDSQALERGDLPYHCDACEAAGLVLSSLQPLSCCERGDIMSKQTLL